MSHTGSVGQSISNVLDGSIGNALGGGLAQLAGQNPYMNQGMAGQQAAYMAQQKAYTAAVRPEWMIAGKSMTITEFADEIFGNTPARTMFLLKHSEKGN
jgi:hypothetical protein